MDDQELNHYALNTQRIIQTFNGYKLPFTPIYGDTTGLGTVEDFKALNRIVKPDSKLELHLHHQSNNKPVDNFKRLETIFKEFDQHIPLTIHGGIFSGGSPLVVEHLVLVETVGSLYFFVTAAIQSYNV